MSHQKGWAPSVLIKEQGWCWNFKKQQVVRSGERLEAGDGVRETQENGLLRTQQCSGLKAVWRIERGKMKWWWWAVSYGDLDRSTQGMASRPARRQEAVYSVALLSSGAGPLTADGLPLARGEQARKWATFTAVRAVPCLLKQLIKGSGGYSVSFLFISFFY